MFPGIGADQMTKEQNFAKMTRELVDIEMAAHGGAVIEIMRDNGKWQVVAGSRYARRIDADTPMDITGPAAGHARMKTTADPTGRRVLGMINNCAGGVTPWGTWLSCEENFHGYFWGKAADDHPEATKLQALWRRRQLVRLGQVARALRHPQGAERSQPLRLGRGNRSVRPGLDAEEAHGARPHEARGRGGDHQPGRPLRRLYRRRRAFRLRLQVRHPRHRGPQATVPPTWTCSTRARFMSPGSMPTAAANGCRSFTAKAR